VRAVRTAALALSRSRTYTPVTYWLGMPLAELNEWLEDIQALEKKRPK